MGADTGILLRPEWVLHVAREVEAFVRSLTGAPAEYARVERLFTSFSPPQSGFERELLSHLRDWLAVSHASAGTRARAERVRQIMVDQYREPWTLGALARAVGCNRTTLQEEFQRLTGTTVHRFLVQRRVAVAARLLKESDLKISCVSLEEPEAAHLTVRYLVMVGPAGDRLQVLVATMNGDIAYAGEMVPRGGRLALSLRDVRIGSAATEIEGEVAKAHSLVSSMPLRSRYWLGARFSRSHT